MDILLLLQFVCGQNAALCAGTLTTQAILEKYLCILMN